MSLNYELAKDLKDAGFPQNKEQLYCAEDFSGIGLRDTVDMIARVEGQHRTFDYSIFPEPIPDDWAQGKARNSYYFSRKYLESEEGEKYTVYYPSLSELIEACGEGLTRLERYTHETGKKGWRALGNLSVDHSYACVAFTPEEAVARLWLALRSKRQ